MDKYLVRKVAADSSEPKSKKPRTEKQSVPMNSSRVREVKGDLFSCPPTECLAHCISADIRMGKGIAVLFKKKFGGVDELHKQGH